MFKLDRNRIHALAGNDTVYARGRSLHEGKHLQHFHWGEGGSILEADVRDQQIEHVRIRLNESGLPISRSCTCREHDATTGQLCRHEVTLLLEARERQREREAYGAQATAVAAAGPLQLHTLVILAPNPSMPTSVELDIGTAALRPVLDVPAFLHEWKTGTGPRDPSRYATAAQRLLSFLAERAPHKAPGASKPIFSQTRSLSITAADLPALLRLAAETGQAMWTDVTRQKSHALTEPGKSLPGTLHLDARLHLHLQTEEPLIFLNDSLTAFQVGHHFYVPSAEALRPVEGILAGMKKNRRAVLVLTPEEAFRFVTDAVPHIRPYIEVVLAPEAVLRTNPTPLESIVILGWSGHLLTARILFRYGTWETDPLHPIENDTLSPVRDKHSENRILNRFRHAGFLPVRDRMALQGDESQFHFLRDVLPLLRKESRIETQPADEPLFRIHTAPLTLTLCAGETRTALIGRFSLENTKTGTSLTQEGILRMVKALAAGHAFYRDEDGRFYSLETDGMPYLADILADPAVKASLSMPGCYDIPSYRLPALAMSQDPLHENRLKMDAPVSALAATLADPSGNTTLPDLPALLFSMLRDYQKSGWRWLATLAHYGFGGILADDMGLGKTVQVIALIHTLRHLETSREHPVLIVAPSSLVLNWKAEFNKFAPDLEVVVMDGPRQERARAREIALGADAELTSYPLIRRDIAELREISFLACILDEAQHIKNPDTANAHAVKGIVATYRFAVTGTPMENTPTELWSVFDFLMPGSLLSHRQFQQRYELPILKNNDTAALAALARMVRPFILRRVKADVLPELPEKIDTLLQCGMTREQQHLYQTFLKKARKSFEDFSNTATKGQDRIRIFALLTRLRQICCDPELVEPGCGAGSGKLELLQEVLQDALDGGHRILLFSQFTSMLDRIDTVLSEQGIERLRLDGRTPIEHRLDLVNAFNAGEGRVFLISLRAGGTGLNLTGADTVIHYDPWWNPAVEDQATDRAHRMGQEHTVQVIRLVTRGSIEEKILQLQDRKRSLIDQVVKPGGTFLDHLSIEEIRALFEEE